MFNYNELQQAVLAEFKREPSVTTVHIGIAANAGVVTQSGQIDNCAGKLAAETAARRVKGDKAVAEEFEVRLRFHVRLTNDEIAGAGIDRLA